MASKEHTPKVTVLMPVYDAEKFLGEAIESILAQTYKDFEFLIINDCSTDKSESIIKSYNDSRIKYAKNEENLELTKTLNKGLHLASGELIVRMDADDISELTRIETQIEFMNANPKVVVCGTWAQAIDEEGVNTDWQIKYPTDHNEILGKIFLQNQIVHPSVIMRKSFIIDKCGGYNENLVRAQDLGLWGKVVTEGGILANIPEMLVKYRVHENMSSTSDYDRRLKNSAAAIINNVNQVDGRFSLDEVKILREVLFFDKSKVNLTFIDKIKLIKKYHSFGTKLFKFSSDIKVTSTSFNDLYVKLINNITQNLITRNILKLIGK